MKVKKNARERREEAPRPYVKRPEPAQPEPEWKKALRQFRAEAERPEKPVPGKNEKREKPPRREAESKPEALSSAEFLSLLDAYGTPPEEEEFFAGTRRPAKAPKAGPQSREAQPAKQAGAGPREALSSAEFLALLNEYGTPPEEEEIPAGKRRPAKAPKAEPKSREAQPAKQAGAGPREALSSAEFLALLNEYTAPPEEEEIPAGKRRPAKAPRKAPAAKGEEFSAERFLSMLDDYEPPEETDPGESSRAAGSPARLMDTVNLEAGMPHADQALITMEKQLSRAVTEGWRVVKLIHGYGSTGKGGVLRTAVREALPETVRQLRARGWVAGEDFGPFSPIVRQMLNEMPALKQDRDLERGNRGITLVWLR